MANTYTFTYSTVYGATGVGGNSTNDYSWDSASNWTPSGITYFNSATTGGASGDSLVLDANGNNGNPYTATYGDASSADFVWDLTISFSGATLTQTAVNLGFNIGYDDAVNISAGTLNLADGGDIQWEGTGVGSGSFVLATGAVLEGSGYVSVSDTGITGGGSIIAMDEGDGTALRLATFDGTGDAIGSGVSAEVQAGAVMDVQQGVASGVNITLDTPALNGPAVLQIDDLPDFGGTVAGLNAVAGPNTSVPAGTNYIDVSGLIATNITSVSFSGNIISITDAADLPTSQPYTIAVSGDYTGDSVNYGTDANTGGTDFWIEQAVCFAAGTDILTPDGNLPVEAITVGDQVIAVVDGQRVPRTVKWIGYRKLALDRNARASGLAPIRIKRGAMAEGLPARDLLVSPPHCMFIDGKLVPAKLLVNDMTIVRDTALQSVEYYHIELDSHAILIAEGVESESYLDTGNRAFFSNAGLALILHPEFHVNAGLRCWEADACAPLAVSPAAVHPVWRPLADRAIALGFVPPAHATTTEADIHLLADGGRIDSIAVKGGVHSFMVPAGVKSLALASRSVTPNVLVQYLDDPRQIGVAVRGITIRGMAEQVRFAADHPALTHGWHAPEQADGTMWRWTNGHGALPIGVVTGPIVVDVMVSETTTYLIDNLPAEGRLAA